MARSAQGISSIWQLSESPIGSGDAGEVYAAISEEQPELTGVLKKPARIASGGTIQRQARQIAREAQALARLDGLPTCKAHPPRLLDQSPDFTVGTADFFIVSETAPGENLADMLSQTRQAGKPFPRRVIITVLDALFDLFARAHRAGVLWNDVKLDHIYWHNPTGEVAVIDWGNAQFLDNQGEDQRHSLPRWEDYRQLVDTLGGFLRQNAPELYDDLGWSEFQSQELDSARVSVLARRIAYQQQVIALRVMEYQSLIRVLLQSEPSLTGLEQVQAYQKNLEIIGATWESEAVLDYGHKLVQSQLAEGEVQTAVRASIIVWDLFGESLGLSWYLIREYFSQIDILSHCALPDLAEATLNQDWPDAIWGLAVIARDCETGSWWSRLMPVLRQKALDTHTPPPYETVKSLLDWAQSNDFESDEIIKTISEVLENWQSRGSDLKESPFEYGILEQLQHASDIPRQLKLELKHSFAKGEMAIRALYQTWTEMNWNSLPEALRSVLVWDPQRWGILRLAEALEEFQNWLEDLYSGPSINEDPEEFLHQLVAVRPPVECLLGTPPWLNPLLKLLNELKKDESVPELNPAIRQWCPWLLASGAGQNIDLPHHNPNSPETISALQYFVTALKTGENPEKSLKDVKDHAPAYHPTCKKLAAGVQMVFSLNPDLPLIEKFCKNPAHPVLQDACNVVLLLVGWRKSLDEESIESAYEILKGSPHQDWQPINHAEIITQKWLHQILPQLDALRTFSLPRADLAEPHSLVAAIKSGYELREKWQTLYDSGLHGSLLESLEMTIETTRREFQNWRQDLDHPSDQVEYLFHHLQIRQIRQIAETHLQLVQRIRRAKLAFSSLQSGSEVFLLNQIGGAEKVLDHLRAIEAQLVEDPEQRHFPGWLEDVQEIAAMESPDLRRERILTLNKDHPLYAWLVQSILA